MRRSERRKPDLEKKREKLTYRLVRSDRKTVSLQIMPEGELVVRAPKAMKRGEIDRFVESKRGWVEKHLRNVEPEVPRMTQAEFEELVRQALEVIPRVAAQFAPVVGVTYGHITIRNQRTRWGSCSSQGNLNFNCLLLRAPQEVLAYVVVHELCHRKEMNHSPKFWAEVERVLPNYRESKRWLKENGPGLIRSLP